MLDQAYCSLAAEEWEGQFAPIEFHFAIACLIIVNS